MTKEELRDKLIGARQQYIDKNSKRLAQIEPVWNFTQSNVPNVQDIRPYIEFCDNQKLRDLWHYGRLMISSAPYCYDDRTEILTEDGWKYFKDLIGQQPSKVATLNESGVLEYQYPTEYTSQQYSGTMFKQGGKGVDLLVTPNHSLFIKNDTRRYDKRFELVEARTSNRHVVYTSRFEWVGCDSEINTFGTSLENFISFIGIWLAEGYVCKWRVIITQKVGDNLKKIINLIENCGFTYNLYISKNNVAKLTIRSKPLAEYCLLLGKSHQKYIPTELKSLPKKYLELLLRWMMLGDGCIIKSFNQFGRKCTNHRYATKSRRLADDVQEVCLKLGFNCHLRNDGIYRVSFNNVYKYYLPNCKNDNRSWENYSGVVYCVTVPNHVIMVRRNGKPVWCGNSGDVGRRMRYLIRDKNTGFILGIVGLSSSLTIPLFDKHIGWVKESKWKHKMVNHTMNLSHCISVPPFNEYLTGKLCALSCKSKEVIDRFENSYKDHAVCWMTTSLFGKSSIYNRLDGFVYLGNTKGYSSVLVPLEVKEKMREDYKKEKGKHSEIYYNSDGTVRYAYGVVKTFTKLSKYADVQRVENLRGVYCIPLASNYKEFLCEEENKLDLIARKNFDIIVEEWKSRWFLPRLQRLENGEYEKSDMG